MGFMNSMKSTLNEDFNESYTEKMTIRHAVRKIKELEKLYESDFS